MTLMTRLLLFSCALLAGCLSAAPARSGQGAVVFPGLDDDAGRPTVAREVAPLARPPVRDQFITEHLDFLSERQRRVPSVSFDFLSQPGTEVDSEAGEYDLSEYRGRARFPLPVSADTFLIFGFEYAARHLSIDGGFSGFDADDTLYKAGIEVGLGHFLTSSLLFTGVFQPGIYSDLDGNLASEDFRYLGRALFSQRFGEMLYLHGGAAVSDDFIDLDVVPLVGFTLLLAERVRVDVLLPNRAEVSCRVGSRSSVYVAGTLEGEQYQWRNNIGAEQEFDVHLQEVRALIGFLLGINDHLSVYAETGATVAGEQEFNNPLGETDGNLEPSIFFRVGIGWDF